MAGVNHWRGVVALYLLMALVMARSRSAEETILDDSQRGPRLTVDQTTLDLGEVAAGEQVEAVFHIRNEGDEPLLIEDAITRVVEGCCPPQPELEATRISPGETARMDLQLSMGKGMGGPHLFEVRVHSNDPIDPEMLLTVRAMFIE